MTERARRREPETPAPDAVEFSIGVVIGFAVGIGLAFALRPKPKSRVLRLVDRIAPLPWK